MKDEQRTIFCGNLRAEHAGEEVVLNGWVARLRDHGQILFIDLRDREGIVQCVVDPDANEELEEVADDLAREYCLSVKGIVRERPEDTRNDELDTGAVEVEVTDIHMFSESEPLPLPVQQDESISGEHRLRYRYLDLRRPWMQDNIRFRHNVVKEMRNFFDSNGFLDIETPFMVKETPGGARSFLVPSRQMPGKFFALAESPQVYKQLLMIAGYEKYYQIVKCFRDEDLRKDRQPEFTQLDLEMSFVDEEDIIDVMERCMVHLMSETLDVEPNPPFQRLDYREAIDRYGTDKPDLRYGMEITDVSDLVTDSEFNVFSDTVERGDTVRGLCIPDGASFSRSEIDDLEDFAKDQELPGLAWFRVEENGQLDAPIAKFFDDEEQQALVDRFDAAPGDLLVFGADERKTVCSALGQLRIHLAEELDLIPDDEFAFTWVVNFPLFERDPATGSLSACHHPFTAPKPEDEEILESDPLDVRARAYDLVLNGFEIAGGSIRVHRPELQDRIFHVLGMDEDEIEEKFSFLIEALEFGAPPHGGIALGLDRFVMVLKGLESIRDCIPFPRSGNAYDPMSDSPSTVQPEFLQDLGLKLAVDPDDDTE
jgi:aspartyl-tRNA synthetase